MDFGDTGDNLYIILDGLCDVIIPMEKNKALYDHEEEAEKAHIYKRESVFHQNRRASSVIERKQRKSMWLRIQDRGFNFMRDLNESTIEEIDDSKDVSE